MGGPEAVLAHGAGSVIAITRVTPCERENTKERGDTSRERERKQKTEMETDTQRETHRERDR